MEDAVQKIADSALKKVKGATTASMYQLPYSGGSTRILLDRLMKLEAREAEGQGLSTVTFEGDAASGLTGPITLGQG